MGATPSLGQSGRSDTPQEEASLKGSSTLNISFANLKVLLQGAWLSGSTMTTSLSPPLVQPYSDAAYNGTTLDYDGTETVGGSWPAGAVDWVLVELRQGTAAATQFFTRAALLMSDGSVKDIDGTSAVAFAGVATGSYFVVIRHRNHVPVMSAGLVPVESTVPVTVYDFTNELNNYPGGAGNAAQKEVTTGVFAMWAADFNIDGAITAPDFDEYLAKTTILATGYIRADYNLDTAVTAPDFDLYLANTTVLAISGVPE
jgi:hypothetical protein